MPLADSCNLRFELDVQGSLSAVALVAKQLEIVLRVRAAKDERSDVIKLSA